MSSVELQVKTSVRTEGGATVSREETLVARRQGGVWRLSLGHPPPGTIVAERKAAAERITREVREGKYKDRIEAMMTLDNAWNRREGSAKCSRDAGLRELPKSNDKDARAKAFGHSNGHIRIFLQDPWDGASPPATSHRRFFTSLGTSDGRLRRFFQTGHQPFPCDDIRATNFRAGVRFDVSQFDSIVSADFLFDAVRSVSRSGGQTTGTSPPTSFANVLCVATQAFTSKMLCDNEASLPATHAINIGVSSQVRDWIGNTRPNHGFVIAGPRGPISSSNPPKDNDARISFYSNMKLRIHYNPAQNPRTPQ